MLDQQQSEQQKKRNGSEFRHQTHTRAYGAKKKYIFLYCGAAVVRTKSKWKLKCLNKKKKNVK